MQKILAVSVLFFIIHRSTTTAQNSAINFFIGSYEQALELAKSVNKYIFVDCYTEWCGPCRNMEKHVFTIDSVADFYNTNFINFKADMEKGQGPALKKKFNIGFYPTYLFLKNDEEIMHRSVGAKTAGEFIKMGKVASDTNSDFYAKRKEYYSDRKNPTELYNYAIACYEAGVGYDANEYFVTQPDDSLLNGKNWNLISIYTSGISSREFIYLAKNRKKFSARYSDYIVNEKIFKVLENYLVFESNMAKDKNVDTLVNEILKPVECDIKDIFRLRLKMFYYQNITGQLEEYVPVAVDYISAVSAVKMNSMELNAVCRTIYLNSNDIKVLMKVESFLEQSIRKDDNFIIHDAYANVLYKTGEYDKSLQAAQEAIDMAKMINADFTETKILIEHIKQIKK